MKPIYETSSMLPGLFLKFVGLCLIVIGLYDTSVYLYALAKGEGTFDFFGRELPAKHLVIRLGFGTVLVFYYLVGVVLLVFG